METFFASESAMERATQIMTGVTHNGWIDFIILPLVLAAVITFIFRSYIFRLEEWLGRKKGDYGTYKSDKVLRDKIIKAKEKEVSDIKEEKTME